MSDIQQLNDQQLARRAKLEKYRQLKVDPFGQSYKVSHNFQQIRDLCNKKTPNGIKRLDLHVSVAGRIMAIRKMGKASFFNLQDKTGKMQFYIGINDVGEKQYELNFEIGKEIAKVCDYVIIMNKVNSSALTEGLLNKSFKKKNIFYANTRAEQKEILKKLVKKGDIVLFENDLPDNYK